MCEHSEKTQIEFSRKTSRLCAVALLALCTAVSVASDIQRQDEDYRRQRAAWMKSEKSPLALAGLFWLKAGDNSFGAASTNDIVLPAGSAPPKVGRFRVSGSDVRVEIEKDVTVTLDGQRISLQEVKSDAEGATPDLLYLNHLRMKVIERGGRQAVRLINLKNPQLLQFKRLDFYEVNPAYRVEGRFRPYQPAKKIQVALITGQVEELECPGVVEFTLEGKTLKLEPVFETPADTKLYFMFKDATNGKETYGGGRYLYSELPKNGRMTLNFNQAHNPYCAYNAYSTCQIPPTQNWLKVAIRAGEKKYAASDDH
jgi:uncharacterized protein